MNKYKLRLVSILIAVVSIAASDFARGDTILLDPDGSGTAPKVSVNYFQFGAGNSVAQGLIPFTAGGNFQLLFQAQLNSIVGVSGEQITPLGLNAATAVGGIPPYEITIVGSVT